MITTFEQIIGISFTIIFFNALIAYIFTCFLNWCANNKLDKKPIFWATFLLTPIFSTLFAILNAISKINEPKAEQTQETINE